MLSLVTTSFPIAPAMLYINLSLFVAHKLCSLFHSLHPHCCSAMPWRIVSLNFICWWGACCLFYSAADNDNKDAYVALSVGCSLFVGSISWDFDCIASHKTEILIQQESKHTNEWWLIERERANLAMGITRCINRSLSVSLCLFTAASWHDIAASCCYFCCCFTLKPNMKSNLKTSVTFGAYSQTVRSLFDPRSNARAILHE